MSGSAEGKPERDQFTVVVKCPGCGQTGNSTWEENHSTNPKGPEACLISVADGFYERVGKKHPYDIELVCKKCETVQIE